MRELNGQIFNTQLSGQIGEKNLNGNIAIHKISGRISQQRLLGCISTKRINGIVKYAVKQYGNGLANRIPVNIRAKSRLANNTRITQIISAGVYITKIESGVT